MMQMPLRMPAVAGPRKGVGMSRQLGYLLWIADVCSLMTETMSLCVSGSTTTPLFSVTVVRCALIRKIFFLSFCTDVCRRESLLPFSGFEKYL